ncbi:hypothetical protein Bbelb_432270 [Branchiostoma belcheri]|nr:hypothetical protein Bbelb_432270 [Branchiostoma belcheri]
MLKKGGMPPEDLETVYTTLIRPVLEYANAVYVGCNTKQNNTLEAVQRRAARIIYGNSTQTTPFSTLQDRRETAAKTLLKQMRHVSHTLHSLMPCDRHQSTRRSLRNGNHISVPNRLEPKNRKDRGHPVANLAARPSATSDNVNKHLHKRPREKSTPPNSKTYTKSQTYPSTQTLETAANVIFVFPHKTSAHGIYIPTRSLIVQWRNELYSLFVRALGTVIPPEFLKHLPVLSDLAPGTKSCSGWSGLSHTLEQLNSRKFTSFAECWEVGNIPPSTQRDDLQGSPLHSLERQFLFLTTAH